MSAFDHEAFAAAVAAVVARHAALAGTPGAVKRGRDSRWPYVPIVCLPDRPDGAYAAQTSQIRGRAFATRDEAIADAAAYLERGRAAFAADLLEPRHRALREHWGLPREIPSRWDPDTLSHVYDPTKETTS